jgi:hypothetical protein
VGNIEKSHIPEAKYYTVKDESIFLIVGEHSWKP